MVEVHRLGRKSLTTIGTLNRLRRANNRTVAVDPCLAPLRNEPSMPFTIAGVRVPRPPCGLGSRTAVSFLQHRESRTPRRVGGGRIEGSVSVPCMQSQPSVWQFVCCLLRNSSITHRPQNRQMALTLPGVEDPVDVSTSRTGRTSTPAREIGLSRRYSRRRVASSIWQSRGLLSPRFRVQVPGDPLDGPRSAGASSYHGTITSTRAWRNWETRQV
jgi:hypothetical protein